MLQFLSLFPLSNSDSRSRQADGGTVTHGVLSRSDLMASPNRFPTTYLPSYGFRVTFSLTLHFLFLLWLYNNPVNSYDVSLNLKTTANLHFSIKFPTKHEISGPTRMKNARFTLTVFGIIGGSILALLSSAIYCLVFQHATFMSLTLLMFSGDVQPNPGPVAPTSSMDSLNLSSSFSSSSNVSLDLSKYLSLVHYNVQSIMPKLDILYCELKDFDILTFSETWLSNHTNTDDLKLQNFHTPERKDRHDGYGGVIVFVKESLSFKRRLDLEINGIECIWIEITIRRKHILIGVFYRPPNSNAEYLQKIETSIELAFETQANDIIITGDLNIDLLQTAPARKMNNLCNNCGLTQIIADPTHFTEHSSSLIDIMLTNDTNNIITSGVADPFLNQDVRYHCPIFGIFNYHKVQQKSFKRQIWLFDKGDYESLRRDTTDTDWTMTTDNNIDTYCKNITTRLMDLSKKSIPNKLVTIRPSEPIWISSFIKQKIRARKRIYKKAKMSNSQYHWEKFRKLRNEIVSLIRESKKDHTQKIANRLVTNSINSQNWWNTLKHLMSPNEKTSVPPISFNDKVAFDDSEKAELLNEFFCSQTFLDETNAVVPYIQPSHSTLSNIVLTADEIELVLGSLPLGKASGPDDINNRILRELSKELSFPLCSLFNESLKTGKVPSSWKEANVCAIFKKGDSSLANNYRPISLLSNLDKVLERLVFKHVYNFPHTNRFLSSFQSGFIPGDSTINQLTFIYDSFCKALDQGKEVRTVFFDISKAFDRVWHRGLLAKLEAAGITGPLLEWFANYLKDRRQRVVIPGFQSSWSSIKAGVPQGSILGPLLFLIYINDIVMDIQSCIRLFADDTSLYIIVEHADVAATTLTSDISKITEWANTWLVSFNPKKTESMIISRKQNKQNHPSLEMLDQEIASVQCHKHLGVTLSDDGTWKNHIESVKVKAWSRLNIMRKLKFILDRKSLETIYFSFIRPLLEYADVVWGNCSLADKEELDKIQHEAARIVIGATKLISIDNIYKETGWETLESRRNTHKLILFYKMVNKIAPDYLSSLVPASVNVASNYNLRNSENIQIPMTRSQLYSNSFLPSAVSLWNSLPLESRRSPTLESFKRSLVNKSRAKPPFYYNTGNREEQIIHTRLRTNCSGLNLTLFQKNIIESPSCPCGDVESTEHFLLSCRLYTEQRAKLFNSLSPICRLSSKVLLFGDASLSDEQNVYLFSAVHTYIRETKRFERRH